MKQEDRERQQLPLSNAQRTVMALLQLGSDGYVLQWRCKAEAVGVYSAHWFPMFDERGRAVCRIAKPSAFQCYSIDLHDDLSKVTLCHPCAKAFLQYFARKAKREQ